MPALAKLAPAVAPLLATVLACLPATGSARQSIEQEDTMRASHAFLAAHPDVGFRRKGLDAYERGNPERAYRHFLEAARFADKPSQAMVAAMLWNGDGVASDRASAYAWMDLAAERGFPAMLGMRERYWEQLDETQRERALAVGPGLYAEYGDTVAKERHRRHMRRSRNTVTGSRVGFAGTRLKLVLNVEGEPVNVFAHDYYHPQWWQPRRYWAIQDADWMAAPRGGVVDIGPLQTTTRD